MTTERETYNGWTNYETWVCKLWIDNDEGLHNYWIDMAQNIDPAENPYMTPEQNKVHALAEALKDEHEQNFHDLLPDSLRASFYSDIMNAALGRVNWIEIAESLLETVAENEE